MLRVATIMMRMHGGGVDDVDAHTDALSPDGGDNVDHDVWMVAVMMTVRGLMQESGHDDGDLDIDAWKAAMMTKILIQIHEGDEDDDDTDTNVWRLW